MSTDPMTDKLQATQERGQRLTLIILVLPLVALAASLGARSHIVEDYWRRNELNLPILQNAMRAADGEDVAAPASLAGSGAGSAIDGMQARALARIALEQGRPAEAERWLAVGLADGRSTDLTRFELCELYRGEGQLEEAKAACAGTIVSAPFWLGQGLRANERADVALAAEYYDLARTTNPDLLTAWVQLGHALFAEKRYAEAIPVFEHVLSADKKPEAAIFDQLGQSLMNAGKLGAAQSVMTRGIELHPTERSLFRAMATSYRMQDDAELADFWYLKLLKRWPDDAFAWAGRGELAMQRGNAEEATGYFQEAVQRNPDDAGYWLGLAGAAETAGKMAVAGDAYEHALALQPDNASSWLSAGRFLSTTDEVEKARSAFAHVLELEPGNHEARQWLDNLVARTATP